METITKGNIASYQVTGSWSIAGSMKADKDSATSKKFTLNVKFDNVPVGDIINKSLEPTKIQWCNGPGRTKYDSWTANQVINIDFKSPGRTTIDPMTQFLIEAKAANIDVTDKQALSEYITKRLGEM